MAKETGNVCVKSIKFQRFILPFRPVVSKLDLANFHGGRKIDINLMNENDFFCLVCLSLRRLL